MIILVKKIPEDLSGIVLREADEKECAAGGLTAAEAIKQSGECSIFSCMVEVDGEPAAFWGLGASSALGMRGYAWLLTTPVVDRCRLRLGKESRYTMENLLYRFPEISVSVHEDHLVAYKWLRWLGFQVEDERKGFLQMIARRA